MFPIKPTIIRVYKTSVQDQSHVQRIRPSLDALLPAGSWSFDLDDCDKVLRVESSAEMKNTELIGLLAREGFHCEELV